jgi:hypothetical protein
VILLVIAIVIVLVMTMVFLFRPSCANTVNLLHLRGGRNLHEEQRAHFNVQLFLDLQFVDESLALDFETLDGTNPNVLHFCKAVQTQVGHNRTQQEDLQRDPCWQALYLCCRNNQVIDMSHHAVLFIYYMYRCLAPS